jgi:hypothetical protein
MGANLRASCCQVASSRFIWFGSSRYDPQVAKSMMFVRCPKGQFTFFSGESTPIFLMWDWGTSNGSYDINHLHRYKTISTTTQSFTGHIFWAPKAAKKNIGKAGPSHRLMPLFLLAQMAPLFLQARRVGRGQGVWKWDKPPQKDFLIGKIYEHIGFFMINIDEAYYQWIRM